MDREAGLKEKEKDQKKNQLLEEIERLKTEIEKLKRKNSKKERTYFNYKQVVNKISDAIYYFKIFDDGSSSHFIEFNKSAYVRLGYTREEMLHMSPFDIDIHKKEDIIKIYDEISRNKQHIFESIHVCKDGSHLPVEIKTHIIKIKDENYIVAVCKDISEKKKSEKVINHAKEQYEQLVESSTNGIAVVQNGKIVFTNQTLVKMFGGHRKEQFLGKDLSEMLETGLSHEYKILTTQQTTHKKITCVWKTLDGVDLHTEVIIIPSSFQEKPSHQLIIQDVTERKQTEQMMIQAEKMNVVGQLAAGIAHEIRNPLTSLKGFVQLFHAGSVPNDMILNIMESELERINVISNEFLTLAKPYNLDFFPVDLQKLLKNVVNLLETEAFSNSVSIVTKFKTKEALVSGINTELKQVFINLIKNAIEAMPDGGRISIGVEKKKDHISISIQDDGIGMSKQQLKRLAEPFYTTKETGTGLGLMVTYKIIHNHFGKIKVKSAINKGTIFTVKLPELKTEGTS